MKFFHVAALQLLLQFTVGVSLASILLVVDAGLGLSAGVGVLVALLPNVYFAWRVFDLSKGRGAKHTMRAFNVGALGKFILTAALFALVFKWLPGLNPVSVILGFGIAQLVNWLCTLVELKGIKSSLDASE